MEEMSRTAQLEKENLELKLEVEMLFRTVVQLNESLNLLLNRYVIRREE